MKRRGFLAGLAAAPIAVKALADVETIVEVTQAPVNSGVELPFIGGWNDPQYLGSVSRSRDLATIDAQPGDWCFLTDDVGHLYIFDGHCWQPVETA